MREYRGKRIDSGEWVYGSLVETEGHCFIHDGSYNVDSETWGLRIGYFQEVIPETVGQFTGLDDKNGNKIFQGDKLLTDLKRPYLVVVWRNAQFVLECEDDHRYYDDMCFSDWDEASVERRQNWFEIIGNIHGEEATQ